MKAANNILCRAALVGAIAITAALAVTTPSQAQHYDRHYDRYDPHRYPGARDDWRRPDWRYTDARRYYDRDRWRGGRWYHGPHGGRTAWWWVAGNDWFAYEQPVYPYPDLDSGPPPVYYDPNLAPPPAAPVPSAPPPAVVYDPYTGQLKPQGGAASYYYCYSPAGYYPQVQDCPSGWVAVPAG